MNVTELPMSGAPSTDAPSTANHADSVIPNETAQTFITPNSTTGMSFASVWNPLPNWKEPARLNTVFVKPVFEPQDSKYWQPVGEWDSPVWGWILINFANYGVQFFLPDGSFYREVSLGGPEGSQQPPRWLPEKTQGKVEFPEAKQLQKLLDSLAEKETRKIFINMINKSMESILPAPTAYAQFSASLLGHPLALVNMAISLELATRPLISHAVLENGNVIKRLMPSPNNENDTPASKFYDFAVKLGDGLKSYDGLVGYWKAWSNEKLEEGNCIDFGTLYTYYTDVKPTEPPVEKSPVELISDANFPHLQPFWCDPDMGTVDVYHREHCKNFRTFGAIVDPFTVTHAYSSILPVQGLKLQPWTWKRAFERMNAFFCMGPLIVTQDVPSKDSEGSHTSSATDSDGVTTDQGRYSVKIPTLGKTEWAWLQPYEKASPDVLENSIFYDELQVGPVEERPKFELGPYTAIESFLKEAKQTERNEKK